MGWRLAAGAAAVFGTLGLLGLRGDPGPEPRLVAIATGPTSGVYYLVGGALCDAVNAGRWRHGLRCVVEPSEGSIANLRSLRTGGADFAIAQSDWVRRAVSGTGAFEAAGPDARLRAVATLHTEQLTVAARPLPGVDALPDLLGRRISVGPPGSGGRATMTAVMAAMGWSAGDFALFADLPAAEAAAALCAEEIDAAVLVVAHPNRAVEDMLLGCDARLIGVGPTVAERLAAGGDGAYAGAAIPAAAYPGLEASVETLAVRAILATSSRTPRAVARVVAAAAEGERFRDRLAALAPHGASEPTARSGERAAPPFFGEVLSGG